MAFATRFKAPQPRLYDIYLERASSVERILEDMGVKPSSEIHYNNGHASLTALLDSEQRANVSRYGQLRPIGKQ